MPTVEDAGRIAAIVRDAHTLAIVGISPNETRDSHRVAAYMKAKNRRVIGVNPGYEEVLGEPCYPSLAEIPEDLRREIDLVVVFRRPSTVAPLLDEAASLGLRRVWLQLGVSSPEALQRADELGLEIVAEKCVRVVHQLSVRDA